MMVKEDFSLHTRTLTTDTRFLFADGQEGHGNLLALLGLLLMWPHQVAWKLMHRDDPLLLLKITPYKDVLLYGIGQGLFGNQLARRDFLLVMLPI